MATTSAGFLSVESLIREAAGHLAVYGSLAPGQPNAWVLDGLVGTWEPGSVRGHLSHVGWGGAIGYPGITWDPEGPEVPVQLFRSQDLPAAWARIDEFEGTDYRRILVPVAVGGRLVVANIYQVRQRYMRGNTDLRKSPVATTLGRAMLLRCPRCGDRSFHRGWFRLRMECGVCGLERERGEHDFFLGAMMLNLIGAEMLFALVIAAWVILTLPTPPWVAIFVVGTMLMVAAPVVFYPFSKMLWLAVDLLVRPERDDTMGGERPLRPPPPTV